MPIQIAGDIVPPNPNHALLIVRNWFQDDRIDHGKKSGDDANPQAERQHRHAGEERATPQTAQGVDEVVHAVILVQGAGRRAQDAGRR